jgi:predicted lactoylglutathione lyase
MSSFFKKQYGKYLFNLLVFFGFITGADAMEPKINVITLGVKDVAKSKKFYEGLGWKASSVSNEHMVAFQTKGIVLCLYPEKLLAEDATVDHKRQGFRGITLAYNVASKEEVNKVLNEAELVGANILKPAQEVFWGGYSGYFADPDGYLWEVAFNPLWPMQDGMVKLPE